MKVVGYENNNKKPEPLLSLVPEKVSLSKSNSTTFDLPLDPSKPDGPKNTVRVRIVNGTEGLRPLIQLQKDVDNVLTKLDLKRVDGNPANNTILQLLSGSLKDQYILMLQEAIAEQWEKDKDAAEKAVLVGTMNPVEFAEAKAKAREETDKPVPAYRLVIECLRRTSANFMPPKVKERVKRWARYHCRKPSDMGVRQWAMLLQNLNNSEIRWLPPYKKKADGSFGEFPDDELKEIILNGVPKRWHGEIERQGFDMYVSSLHEVVDFFEKIESAEALTAKMEQPIPKKTADPKKKQRTASNSDKKTSQEDLVCPIHGKGHSEQQCRTIQRMKKNNTWKGVEAYKSKNKTWSRQAEENKDKAKKELATYIQKTITKSLRKELNAFSKKRKSKKQDSDDESLNAVESLLNDSDDEVELKFDPASFNYADFGKLSIESDNNDDSDSTDEISV
jgi:hypothetical protein